MIYDIPGTGAITLKTLLLNVDCIMNRDGKPADNIFSRLMGFGPAWNLIFFASRANEKAKMLADQFNAKLVIAPTGSERAAVARKSDPRTCVAIGSYRSDLELMKIANVGIVPLQACPVHVPTMLCASIVVPSITDALVLLTRPELLIAAMQV